MMIFNPVIPLTMTQNDPHSEPEFSLFREDEFTFYITQIISYKIRYYQNTVYFDSICRGYTSLSDPDVIEYAFLSDLSVYSIIATQERFPQLYDYFFELHPELFLI